MTRATRTCIALLWVLPLPVAAQAPSVITMDEEPHHHLVLKNDVVTVFGIELAPRDAILMHRHDHDEVSIAISDATTVSTTPGQADILTISKPGDVSFALGGWEHSVRNIGPTAYHSISIGLLRTQANARNLCGNQIPVLKPECPAAAMSYANAPRVDQPQFETDQIRVNLTRIRPMQQASFGESKRDDLVIMIDEAVIAEAPAKGAHADQKLAPGSSVWIARGGAGRVLKNNSDKEVRVVTVSFKP